MQQPRKKLGTNLGIAPAFAVLTPVTTSDPGIGPEPDNTPSAVAVVHTAAHEASEDAPQPESAESREPAASSIQAVARHEKAAAKTTHGRAAVKQQPPKAPTRKTPQQADDKRVHGTFSVPYERKTDGIETRQTTLTVPLELDDRFETYFRRVRGQHRTRSALWAAAMQFYLEHHD